jgi:hypothetical protein
VNLMPFRQLLGGEDWTEIMPLRLLQNRRRLSLRGGRNPVIGGFSPQSMHHNQVPFAFHALEQLAHSTLTDADPLSRLSLRDLPVAGLLQPMQLVSFLLAHRDSFHPSALRLSRGTFYFGQLGNFNCGATQGTTVLFLDLTL